MNGKRETNGGCGRHAPEIITPKVGCHPGNVAYYGTDGAPVAIVFVTNFIWN